MAKRKKADAIVPASAAPLAHNPFAALFPATLSPATSTPQIEAAKEPAPKESARQQPAPKEKPAKVAMSEEETKNWGTKLVLSREKKGRGGKTVTRITGLPKARLELVAGQMKKSLGCGASVDGDDVLLHGMLTERGAEWLLAQGAKRVIVGN